MLFNSLQFAVFFIIVYALYISINHKWQNRMLLVASYIFYGAWDWRFLFLIIVSTVLDYYCGLGIHASKDEKRRKLFLFFSVFGNLSILGFFKYFNFFASNLQVLLGRFGFTIQPHFLHIILPVGISFYTFQTMSYTIDIYRRKMRPTKRFFDFALFVAFFPQLVAGPIERARRLLPQILFPRKLGLAKFYEGAYLIFWGLFQKVFVADNLARIVDPVFAGTAPYNGTKVLIALYAFAFQIFCDFAGYSNIARGLGKCMGFDIMVNFRLPYFSTSPREFWQRWHISLSSWMRDYLYISLGGNRKGAILTYRNLMITMLLAGLWHGAAWTFIVWGIYHAALLIIQRLTQPLFGRISLPKNIFIERVWFLVRVIFFFHLTCLGWLVFRAESMAQVYNMLQGLLFNFHIALGLADMIGGMSYFILFLLVIQVLQYVKKDLLLVIKWPKYAKLIFIVAIIYLSFSGVIFGGNVLIKGGNPFIYFQF